MNAHITELIQTIGIDIVDSDSDINENQVLPWTDYFMSLCFLSAARSKDPRTQVGACIINEENKIVGMGYNGMPKGIDDKDLPWDRYSVTDDPLETKYPYVCHAEMNAIMNMASTNAKGCTLYTTHYPCNDCAKLIIQAGIKDVVYATEPRTDSKKNIVSCEASNKMFLLAGIKTRRHKPRIANVSIDFEKSRVIVT